MSADNQLTSSQFFSHRNYFMKKVFSLVIYKINFLTQLLFKFKGPLLKPKPKIFFLNFEFEFFNIHISHLALHSMINMALKWHHKNISNKIIDFINFWWSHDVLFGSFDCDYTLYDQWNILKLMKIHIDENSYV